MINEVSLLLISSQKPNKAFNNPEKLKTKAVLMNYPGTNLLPSHLNDREALIVVSLVVRVNE